MSDSERKIPLVKLKALTKLDRILIGGVVCALLFALIMLGMYRSERTKNMYRALYSNESSSEPEVINKSDFSIEEMKSMISDMSVELDKSNQRAEEAEEKATEAEKLLNRGLESTTLIAEDGYLKKKGDSTPLKFHGSCTYSFNAKAFTIQCEKITNTNILSVGSSGDFSVKVYFCSGGPYAGNDMNGILMAEFPFANLQAGCYYYDVNKSASLKNNPLSGYYYVAICIVELNSNGSSYITDYRNFPLQKWDFID